MKGGQRSRLRGGRAGEEEGRNKKRGREDVGEDRFVWEPVWQHQPAATVLQQRWAAPSTAAHSDTLNHSFSEWSLVENLFGNLHINSQGMYWRRLSPAVYILWLRTLTWLASWTSWHYTFIWSCQIFRYIDSFVRLSSLIMFKIFRGLFPLKCRKRYFSILIRFWYKYYINLIYLSHVGECLVYILEYRLFWMCLNGTCMVDVYIYIHSV